MAEYVYGERLVDVSRDDTGQWIEKRVVPERRERIVRCRDCAYYWEEDPLGNRDACTQGIVRTPYPRHVSPDGFCAWGEPREENE